MPEPVVAGLSGLAAASALVIGAVAAVTVDVPRRVVALVMAFGAGALISALSFDLAEEAFAGGGTVATAVGLAAGAIVFFIGDTLLERRIRRRRKEAGPATSGPAIVLGTLLDGLPESFVLGATFLGGTSVSISLLAAILISNLPEGIGGGRDLADEGHSRRFIIGLWIGVALASGVAASLGSALLVDADPVVTAVAQAFAGGAILAMLADTMIPESYEFGGEVVGLVTVIGFAVAFLLSRAG